MTMGAFYDLPTSVTVGGVEREIRSDYRAALDIIAALSDTDLNDAERAFVVMKIFYVDEIDPKLAQEAVDKCMWFIGQGEEPDGKPHQKLMDWEQDFMYIVAPVNKAAGKDVRSVPYMHWWTFLAFYAEIGECMFSQIVGIRSKIKNGKKLDKQDREFYRRNRAAVDFKNVYSNAENDLIKSWGGG